eukprot:CAMPEP_0115130778 /NCGR_PEP_ID=MMETSP0227-20121206/52683_1 /TAXON_ID=89957 /ORGANISM="Polarella glacialis, Strain CCMP 1383" /LENGTH=99 /DNA_ID=CAMNT_0002536091 /DNA_START=302 /DNA_END=601 /DNA_ORIENTATION=+
MPCPDWSQLPPAPPMLKPPTSPRSSPGLTSMTRPLTAPKRSPAVPNNPPPPEGPGPWNSPPAPAVDPSPCCAHGLGAAARSIGGRTQSASTVPRMARRE